MQLLRALVNPWKAEATTKQHNVNHPQKGQRGWCALSESEL